MRGPDRELNFRESDGISVSLWLRDVQPPELYVSVLDSKKGVEYAPVNIPEPGLASHYFEHALSYVTKHVGNHIQVEYDGA